MVSPAIAIASAMVPSLSRVRIVQFLSSIIGEFDICNTLMQFYFNGSIDSVFFQCAGIEIHSETRASWQLRCTFFILYRRRDEILLEHVLTGQFRIVTKIIVSRGSQVQLHGRGDAKCLVMDHGAHGSLLGDVEYFQCLGHAAWTFGIQA